MTIYRMKMSFIQYRPCDSDRSMGVDLGPDAPTPERGLYHGGDTGTRVAIPDSLCIKIISNTGNQPIIVKLCYCTYISLYFLNMQLLFMCDC